LNHSTCSEDFHDFAQSHKNKINIHVIQARTKGDQQFDQSSGWTADHDGELAELPPKL
jgi:hypothetical protein